MASSDELRKLLSNKFQVKQDRITALPGQLGDGYGNVNVPGREHYVYARVISQISEVFNNRVPAENDLLVMVGIDPAQPDLFQVLSTRTSTPGGSTGGAITGYAPAIRYQWMATGGGQDPLFVDKRQFLPKRIGALTGMLLQVYRDVIWTGSSWVAINTQNFSLASFIPATTGKAALVLITIDNTGTIIKTKGSEVDIADLAPTDIPTIPADTAEILGAVRVYYGQTAIQEARTNTDIIDLRFSTWGMNGETGVLADHDHSGDSGDGGQFPLVNLLSTGATDGQVATADGSGGIAWEEVTASGGGGELDFSSANVSNPPTQAEIIAALGSPATRGPGYNAIIDDAGAHTKLYQAVSDGSYWHIQPLARASGSTVMTITSNGFAGASAVNAPEERVGAILSQTIGGVTYQVTAFWDKDSKLAFAKRSLPAGAWTIYTTAITLGTDNRHNFISIGIDPNGYLHVCYDMHDNPLLYRRSTLPISTFAGTLTTTLSMLGTNESYVAYPMFVNDRDGKLYFFFRDGISGDGDVYFYTYNEATTTWSAAAGTGSGGKLLDGKSPTPDQSAYLFMAPEFDASGNLHLAWDWKEDGMTDSDHDVYYAKWNGTSFLKSDGTAQTVPITPSNGDLVRSVAQGTHHYAGALNVDSNGYPHLVYKHDDGSGYQQLYYSRWNGSAWVYSQITNTAASGLLAFGLAIHPTTDEAIILSEDTRIGTGLAVLRSTDYTTWASSIIYSTDFGSWDIQYDRQYWLDHGVLHLPIAEWFASGSAWTVKMLEWRP